MFWPWRVGEALFPSPLVTVKSCHWMKQLAQVTGGPTDSLADCFSMGTGRLADYCLRAWAQVNGRLADSPAECFSTNHWFTGIVARQDSLAE